MDNTINVMMKGVVIILIVALLWTISEYKSVPNLIEKGYEVYLDGEEVNADKVDINQYSISIDRENECIYLTESNHNGTTIFPMIIPMY